MNSHKLIDNKGNELENYPMFFHLNWHTRETKWYKHGVLPICRKDINKKIMTNWGKSQLVLILTGSTGSNYTPNTKIPFTSVDLLISNLQKAIRRRATKKAILTVQTLIDISPVKLLRRLPIIMLEDVGIFSEFSTLMWLMCAMSSKDFSLSNSMVAWLYGLVFSLSEYRFASELSFLDSCKRYIPVSFPDEYKNLFYALHLRVAYGGMISDTKMINWFINNISDDIQSLGVRFLGPPNSTMKRSDWIIESIDFHCIPKIVNAIVEKYEFLDAKNIKRAIWFNSSGLNVRELPDIRKIEFDNGRKETAEVWNIIHSQYRSLERYFLKNIQ